MNVRLFARLPRPVFAAEDGGGAAPPVTPPAASDAPPSAATDPTPAPSASTTASPPPASESPSETPWWHDGVPEHLRGADERATVANLMKAYTGAREAISKAGEVPKDIAGYALAPSEKLKPYTDGLDKDPFWQTTRELALKHGLPAPKFQALFGDLMEAMVDKALVAEPFSPEAERAALLPQITDPKHRATEADRIARENIATVRAWGEQGLDKGVVATLEATMDRASTNKLVAWIREGRAEQAPALGGATPGVVTEAEIDARIKDPRNNFGTAQYDEAFAAKTTEMKKAFYR